MIGPRRGTRPTRRGKSIASQLKPLRLLILGGTTEASRLAEALVGRATVNATVSLAGRTQAPLPPPLPFRIGGFGGTDGLAQFLVDNGFEAVVDATHPFAARISANATAACRRLALPLARYSRAPWMPQAGDRWTPVEHLAAAALALGPAPRVVFLTIGRLGLPAFLAAPQHIYLIRAIDPPDPADLPPQNRVVLERGPFTLEAEEMLMRREAIDILVTKNSGGEAGAAKLAAARHLGLPIVMVEPPEERHAPLLAGLPAVLDWIAAQGAEP